MNTIFNLVDHAVLLSDNQFHDNNIKIVKQILFNNCFPEHIIDRFVNKRLHFLKNRSVNNLSIDNDRITTTSFISLPYVESLGNIDRIFKKIGFNVVHNIPNKLNNELNLGRTDCPSITRPR